MTALSSFELRNSSPYAALIVSTMKQSYEYAKKGVADELGVSSPASKRETTQIFNQNAQAVVDKQMSDLLFAIKSDALQELRRQGTEQVDIPQVVKTASDTFDTFLTKQVAVGGAIAVAMAVNRGRDDVFAAYRDDIATYTYSAILDARVCPTCKDLDGTTMDYAGYRAFKWKPPIHLGNGRTGSCRCIIFGTKKDQQVIPALTAIPEAPGGITEPSL